MAQKRPNFLKEQVTIEPDLENAIRGAKRGEESAIVVLFRCYNPPLLRYLRHQIPADYEDVASETWAAIAKGIKDFSGGPQELRAWIFGIARKKIADQFRIHGKSRLAVQRERIHIDGISRDLSDPTATPAVANLSAEEAIETLLSSLPPHHAEVILLRVVADLSVEDVANLMGKSQEAIRVIQHRAINTLVKKFHRNVVT